MKRSASASTLARARIDAHRQQSRVRAGALIVSVFGDAVAPRGGRLWVGSLIRLLQPLGIDERLVRTAVSRLAKQAWLRIEPHGRRADYLLTEAGQRRFEEASRTIYAARPRAWDGRWRLLLLVRELDAKAREPLRRALAWQGFGQLGADCFVHPGADLDETLQALATEGLTDAPAQLLPLLAVDARHGLGQSDADLVRRAWNLDERAQAYADFDTGYRPLWQALAAVGGGDLAPEDAFLLRTLLIHDWRRLLLRDPELPDVLLPAGWPGRAARQLTRELYQRLLAPSERHLDALLQRADGQALPPPDAASRQRFGGPRSAAGGASAQPASTV
ncbi:MAG: phenylacetic acid degradation operon negative regulatory protein PaaX [Proteobacteria bacterium]|nr:phenylacetic acid degradation operon negative regulatory protein PaaX [Pseudomonadota bacterium]